MTEIVFVCFKTEYLPFFHQVKVFFQVLCFCSSND